MSSMWKIFTDHAGGATSRNAVLRMATVCAVLGVGAVAVQVAGWEVDKPEVMLREELKTIPTDLANGKWTAKLSEDRTMSREEEDVLQTNKYLLRRYRDTEKGELLMKLGASSFEGRGSAAYQAAKVGETLSLNLNYYGTGGSDTHVPDVCWTGSGMEREFNDSGDLDLKDVVLKDGSKIDVPVKLVAFKPTAEEMRVHRDWAGKENEHLLFVAYTFNVNGEYVKARELLPQKFYEMSDYPFLFHAKIEVTVNERCTQAEARAVLEPFIRAVVPEVVSRLPDVKEELAYAEALSKAKAGKGPFPSTRSGSSTSKPGISK